VPFSFRAFQTHWSTFFINSFTFALAELSKQPQTATDTVQRHSSAMCVHPCVCIRVCVHPCVCVHGMHVDVCMGCMWMCAWDACGCVHGMHVDVCMGCMHAHLFIHLSAFRQSLTESGLLRSSKKLI